jgi:hypothetical protein
MSPVWECENGARLHAWGLLRLPDGTLVNEWTRRYWPMAMMAARMQPLRRVRALMVWAEFIMANDKMRDGESGHTTPTNTP